MDELEYRRLLKTLPHAIEPDRDLFPGIAARLETRAVAKSQRRGLFPFAAAAGFTAVAIAAGWMALQRAPGEMPAPTVAESAPMMLREARALRAEFDAALVAGTANRWTQVREQADPRFVAAWTELDAAEAELSEALEQDPNARFLLNRLKQVQEQRLHLAQKALSA
ncbi:MAG TPA: hypothetical protein PLB00_07335 [Pseudomonadota bacterium]|nr:hypothetical protein [Pseudomonadota bacterium]